jgi:hypothetical protein
MSDQPVARFLPDTIQYSQQTDIHAPGGILFSVLFLPLIHFVTLDLSLLPHVTYVPYDRPYTTNTTQTAMPPVGFEPIIPASERSQTHAFDRAATWIGIENTQ